MRKFLGLFCAAAMTLPALVITASPAAAAPVVTCTKASGTAKFTPGLPPVGDDTKVKAKLTSTGSISGCTGSGHVSKGTTKFTQTSKSDGSNCAELIAPDTSAKPTKGTLVITWAGGKGKSTAAGTAIKQTDATHANITGKITAGKFKGKTFKAKVEFKVPTDGSCSSKPLTKVTYKNVGKTTVG
jgi:hypothetical protein